jgi:hypothetical protein
MTLGKSGGIRNNMTMHENDENYITNSFTKHISKILDTHGGQNENTLRTPLGTLLRLIFGTGVGNK